MTAHGTALFIHVVAAIGLVGGSVWTGAAGHRLRRARTVDAARAHAEVLRSFSRASAPLAVVTIVAGAYLATVSRLWTASWLLTSTVLFAAIGVAAGVLVTPATTALVEALDDAPPGPVPTEVVMLSHAPAVSVTTSLFAGIDLAILFLMTNKPAAATTCLLVALTGIGIGIVLGARERRLPRTAAV